MQLMCSNCDGLWLSDVAPNKGKHQQAGNIASLPVRTARLLQRSRTQTPSDVESNGTASPAPTATLLQDVVDIKTLLLQLKLAWQYGCKLGAIARAWAHYGPVFSTSSHNGSLGGLGKKSALKTSEFTRLASLALDIRCHRDGS
ncbi:putative Nitrate excretion transporter1 [Operophtera brumata]|uniref:Putative Nitrate excretion transporter1 n=1 Tax=Operophtera brumata TaxID=104452 RepID=A0A0L7L1R4_OPEBR|nr:putative Nitrate excretion transporter1 [Operophtera brumata]